jgi:hypothetical protein
VRALSAESEGAARAYLEKIDQRDWERQVNRIHRGDDLVQKAIGGLFLVLVLLGIWQLMEWTL